MSYTPDYSQRQDMLFGVEARLLVNLEWAQRPLALATNNEVFSNLRRVDRPDQDMTTEYTEIRERLGGPSGNDIFVVFAGPNGSGKGTGAMGFTETLQQDEYLKEMQKENNVKVTIITVPFSLYAHAAKTAEVRVRHPYFYVDPYNPDGTIKQHGQFTQHDYTTRISPLMLMDILDDKAKRRQQDEEVVTTTSRKKPVERRLYVVEQSTPTAIPQEGNDIPVKMEGTDRGGIVAATLFRDPQFRDNTYMFAYEGNRDVEDDALAHRNDIDNILGGKRPLRNHPLKLIYRVKGQEHDIQFIPEPHRLVLLNFWYNCMASPLAIARGRQEFTAVKEQTGVKTDREYYAQYGERLGNPNNFFIVQNAYMEGVTKTAVLNYFTDALPVKNYPSVMYPEERAALDYLRRITP